MLYHNNQLPVLLNKISFKQCIVNFNIMIILYAEFVFSLTYAFQICVLLMIVYCAFISSFPYAKLINYTEVLMWIIILTVQNMILKFLFTFVNAVIIHFII